MMRVLIAAWLAALSATAAAELELADLSEEQVKDVCAQRATGGADKAQLARRAGVALARTEITDAQLIADRVCRVRLQRARLLARMRAKVDADQVQVDRLLGRLAPGEGYHIVWLPRGRVAHSPRAAYYRNGRAVPAYAPAPR